MIGVLAREEERGVVEEFFQLFKTPWEMHRTGETYDVVLTTADAVPDADARLLLVYGSQFGKADRRAKITPRVLRHDATLRHGVRQIPLYGDLLTFDDTHHRAVCTTRASEAAAIMVDSGNPRVVRIGYDLFQEIEFLLNTGQPVENAHLPTLEDHIGMLRDLILDAGISVLEIPPSPAGSDFAVCLTHDIDFVGIRRHKFDHTMWGFLLRSTVGVARDFLKRKVSFERLLKTWKAAVSLPFVYLGWVKDFWMLFDWYLKVEKNLSPTYYFIPFKKRSGEKVSARNPERRAAAYDITDIPELVARLQAEGCEVGVHGIDAWHSADRGREELKRVAGVTRQSETGIRMHWLLRNEDTYRVLEDAGYAYDSTAGYNETPGYRSGTAQVFRPLGRRHLLELPLHIQDGALFYPKRLGLSESEAWARCEMFIANAKNAGGVLTVLWHDRSPGPERFWGEFYARLVEKLKSMDVWFATAGQVVSWFRLRRKIIFERGATDDGGDRIRLRGIGRKIAPSLRVRVHSTAGVTEFAWDGETDREHGTAPKMGDIPGANGLSVSARE